MKTNSTVFNVIVILLVGVVCYYSSGNFKLLYRCIKGGNSQKPTQTAIEKEHSAAPQVASKQTETEESKIDSQKVLSGQPNYTSRLDVPKREQDEPLSTGRGIDTPSVNPVTQKVILPSPPEGALELFEFYYKLYQDRAKAQYEIDMSNAGDNKTLQSLAQQRYTLNMAKINSWQNEIEGKFRIIDEADVLNWDEKEYVRNRIINKAGNSIPLNSAEETQEMKNRLSEVERQQRQQQVEFTQQQPIEKIERANQEFDQHMKEFSQKQEQERRQRELTNRLDDIEQQQRWNNMECDNKRDNWQSKYNYMENKWQYAPSDSQLKYNPLDRSWQYVPSH